MGITYGNKDWTFDRQAWSESLHKAREEDIQAACELTGLSRGGLYHWMRPDNHGAFRRPSMQNFLAFCNLLHLTPSDYFKLEE
jgi:hypothetical protein